MAEKHELDITIDNNGEVAISVSGITGAGCMKITEELENELGIVIAREKRSEYYKEKTVADTGINIQKQD